jgi:hypothetical protein
MRTISRLFDSHAQVARAVATPQAAGIPREQISVVGSYNDNGEQICVVGSYNDEMGAVWRGPGAGVVVGTAAGLLAGVGAFGGAGTGPVGAVAGLALVGAAWGGFVGGLIGTLADLAKKPGEPNVAQGVILVMARVDEKQAGAAQAVLRRDDPFFRTDKTGAYTNPSWVRVQSGAK